MSGGSLNYLYCKDAEDLFQHYEDLKYAEQVLIDRGYMDIAKDVRRLLEYLYTAQNRIDVLNDQLKDVFYAIEWCASSDIGEEDLIKYLEEYRNKGSEDADH